MEELLGNLTIGVILLITAIIYIYKQPKNINSLYGYRTPRSMKNKENWEFANKVAAKYLLYISIGSILLGVVSSYLFTDSTSAMVTVIATCVALVVQLPIIEGKLKKREQ